MVSTPLALVEELPLTKTIIPKSSFLYSALQSHAPAPASQACWLLLLPGRISGGCHSNTSREGLP